MKLSPAESLGVAAKYYGYYSASPAIFNLYPSPANHTACIAATTTP